MKKKILLAIAIIAMLTCLFAISTSAARVENYDAKFTLKNESKIVHYEAWFYNDGKNVVRKGYTDSITVSFIDSEGNPLTEVAMWEYDENEGKYYSLVWYISDWEYVTETQTYSDDKVGTQEYLKYISAVYTLESVRAVDLRYVTGTENRTNEVWSEAKSLKYLKGIYLTNGTLDDTSDDIKLQDAIGIGRDNNNHGYVGWEAQFNATGNKIVVANLRDCDFECDKEQNYGNSNTWSRAEHLQCIWYPDTVKYLNAGVGGAWEIDLGDGIEVIACQILRDNKRIKEFTVPNSVKFINNEAFRGTDLTKLTLSENLITHGNDPFLYTGGADNIVISKNILTSTYTKNNIPKLIANQSATIYFDGNFENAESLMAKIIAQDSGYNNKITLVDYKTTQDRGGVKNVVIFYNYNTCEAFYQNVHNDDNNPCTVNCDRCGLKGFEENPVHNYVTSIAYENYLANGTKTQICQNEGCAHQITPNVVSVDPIIASFKGFSVKENGEGITFGYTVDYDAVAEFEEINNTKVEFGFAVAVKSFLGENAPLNENGEKSSENVIKVAVNNEYNYTGADFVLRGNWDRNTVIDGEEISIKDVEFYMAGYLIANGNVCYLNGNGSSTNAGVITFNSCNTAE